MVYEYSPSMVTFFNFSIHTNSAEFAGLLRNLGCVGGQYRESRSKRGAPVIILLSFNENRSVKEGKDTLAMTWEVPLLPKPAYLPPESILSMERAQGYQKCKSNLATVPAPLDGLHLLPEKRNAIIRFQLHRNRGCT